jgi:Alpha-galactosidase
MSYSPYNWTFPNEKSLCFKRLFIYCSLLSSFVAKWVISKCYLPRSIKPIIKIIRHNAMKYIIALASFSIIIQPFIIEPIPKPILFLIIRSFHDHFP